MRPDAKRTLPRVVLLVPAPVARRLRSARGTDAMNRLSRAPSTCTPPRPAAVGPAAAAAVAVLPLALALAAPIAPNSSALISLARAGHIMCWTRGYSQLSRGLLGDSTATATGTATDASGSAAGPSDESPAARALEPAGPAV